MPFKYKAQKNQRSFEIFLAKSKGESGTSPSKEPSPAVQKALDAVAPLTGSEIDELIQCIYSSFKAIVTVKFERRK